MHMMLKWLLSLRGEVMSRLENAHPGEVLLEEFLSQ